MPEQNPDVSFAAIENATCDQLDTSDPIFTSLRTAYPGFDAWFRRAQDEQRPAWIIRDGDHLGALCIYKPEKDTQITDDAPAIEGSLLKLCTLKVGEDLRGTKMGEALLNCAFTLAHKRDIDWVYFTTDDEAQPQLTELACRFGFEAAGRDLNSNDTVFLRRTHPRAADELLPPEEFAFRFYPKMPIRETTSYYLIPIQPPYHNQLFPMVSDLRGTVWSLLPDSFGSEAYCMEKAYLSRTPANGLKPGDVLLFYRSEDRQSVEVAGTVTAVQRLTDLNELCDAVKRRTVYTEREIEQLLAGAKSGVLVVTFLANAYFGQPVPLEQLRNLNISPAKLASVGSGEVPQAVYQEIMTAGNPAFGAPDIPSYN